MAASSADETRSGPGLIRALGPLMATAVVVGTVIGSGVFKKPTSIAQNLPDFSTIALVWILGGLLSLLGALSLAEVAVLFPRAGGNYVFLREGFGRLAGFLWGWVEFWIIRAASLAALATIFTESLYDILRQTGFLTTPAAFSWDQPCATVTVLFALAAVNIRGVRWGGGLQFFITAIKVATLLTILVLPFVLWNTWSAPGPTPPASKVPFTLGGFGTALLGVLWAYHGWMNIAPVAGEVKDPQRNLPVAFLAGTSIVMFLYLGANLAYHLVIPQHEIAAIPGDTNVAAEFARRLLGPIGLVLASAAVMCSVFGALNGNLLVGPRLLYAMGEDGLAPRAMSRVHPVFHTPALAIAAMAGWAMLLVLAAAFIKQVGLPRLAMGGWTIDLNPPEGKALFDILTDFAMFGAVIFETLAVATIFVFRRTLPDVERPYRCLGYPLVPILYLILPAFVLFNMFENQSIEAAVGLCFIGVGAAVYGIWLRK